MADYLFGERNWACRIFGHRWRSYTGTDGVRRRTCSLDGRTEPPFRKLHQFPPYDELPDDLQPEGAV
jgi:hypothetical protein